MAAKQQRIEALRTLVAANGITLDESDATIQQLNGWFRSQVEAESTDPKRLRAMWYSVVNDLALFLGDLIVRRAPQLRWVFFDKFPRDVAFQRHVIMGFSRVPNRNYNLDIDWLIATYAHRVVAGLPVRDDDFLRIVEAAVSKA